MLQTTSKNRNIRVSKLRVRSSAKGATNSAFQVECVHMYCAFPKAPVLWAP